MPFPSLSMIVLFTYGTPMAYWKQSGLIDREIGYYKILKEEGISDISFLTYSRADKKFEPEIAPLKVLPKIYFNSHLVFGLLAPVLYRQEFQAANVYKSNQIQGSWVGLVAKILKPRAKFIVRCGWVPTREMMIKNSHYGQYRILKSEFIQQITYRFADLIFVSTPGDKEYLCIRFNLQPDKIIVIPNSVDISQFQPPASSRSWDGPIRIIAVGRQVEMKNFQSLILALHGLCQVTELCVAGDGPYKSSLIDLAHQSSTPVRFLGSIPNSQLPEHLRNSHILVMPQTYGTGLSKVIIEAMACGLIVVASDIPAHREVIRHGKNGFLCGIESEAIHQCLQEILELSPGRLSAIAQQAVRDVSENFSMRAIAIKENSIIMTLFNC